MCLHTQLLRGLFALPVLVLLAVAGMTAPAPSGRAQAAEHARTVVIASDGQVAIVASTANADR